MAEHPLDLVGARDPELARRVQADLGALQELSHEAPDVRVQPRHAGELDGVGDLVQRHPGHELLLLGPERLHGLTEVGEHEQQSWRPVLDRLVEQHEFVLAQHALAQIPDDHADLGAQHDPHADLHGRLERAEVVACPLQHGVEQEPHRVEIRGHPLLAADALRWRERPGRRQARVGHHAGLRLGGQRGEI